MRGWLAIVTVAALVATGCGADPAPDERGNVVGRATFVTSKGEVDTAALRVADSDQERRNGLMGTASLGHDSGMVFVFQGEDGGFWMKDTLIPLSIAFWGDDRDVLDILEMEPCRADPCPTYTPDAPYTHALEMNAGWFTDHGIEIGDRVELTIGTE